MAGTFTQEDPSGLAGGINLYAYGAGDPITYGDPHGRRPMTAGKRERAGCICLFYVSCDRVEIIVMGSTNKAQGLTLGYAIIISPGALEMDEVPADVLNHELGHVWPMERDAFSYTVRGAVCLVTKDCHDPMVLEIDYDNPKSWSKYSFNQQAEIFSDCFNGNPIACQILETALESPGLVGKLLSDDMWPGSGVA